MFKLRLGKTPNNLSEEDFLELGKSSDGYSGSDIAIVVKEAMMMPVRRCQTATRFIETNDGFFIPTYPSDPNGKDLSLMQIEPSKLKAPDVTTDDFFCALSKIRPSVSPDDLDRQIEFTNDFGQEG